MIDDEKDYMSIRYKLQQLPSANQMKTAKNAQKVRFDTDTQWRTISETKCDNNGP